MCAYIQTRIDEGMSILHWDIARDGLIFPVLLLKYLSSETTEDAYAGKLHANPGYNHSLFRFPVSVSNEDTR